jgi:hypothetical protein
MSHVAIRAQYGSPAFPRAGILSLSWHLWAAVYPSAALLCCVGLRLAADKANKRQFVRLLIRQEHLKPKLHNANRYLATPSDAISFNLPLVTETNRHE